MLTIVFPESAEQSVVERRDRPGFEYKAGGTDVVDRVKHRAASPRGLIHLRRLAGLDTVSVGLDEITLGAGVTLDEIALHPTVRERAPVLAEAALATATPQVRAVATLGGALAQRPRCPYFRDELFSCAKKGGDRCLAKEGDHSQHAIFDNASCMAPHPSTVGAALLALGASLDIRLAGADPEPMPLERFFTVDVKDPRPDNGLPEGALIEQVRVALPVAGSTKQRYLRASPRHLADWADVEVAVVLEVAPPRIRRARVVLGGVGRVPVRAVHTESALLGRPVSTELLKAAAAEAVKGATPLDGNRWKLRLTESATLAALEEALA